MTLYILGGYQTDFGKAGEAQVPNAKRVATWSLGGSATTSCSFVIGRA